MSNTKKRPRPLRARRVGRATRRPARSTISRTEPRLETHTVNPRDRHHAEASGRRYALLYHRRRLTNAAALGLGDGLALVAAMLLAGATRWWLIGEPMIPLWSLLLLPAWGLGAWMTRLLPGWGLGAVEELRRTMILLGVVFVGTAVVLFLSKQSETHSRLTLTLGYLLSIPLVPYARTLVKKGLIRSRLWGLPAAIYGGGSAGRRIIEALREEIGIGYIPIAVFDDDSARWGGFVAGVPVLGDTHQCTHEAPMALLAMPDIDRAQLPALLEGPLSHYKQIVILPDLFEIPTLWVRSCDIGGVLGLEITSNLLDPLARLLKRTMDLALVLTTLPLWLPLCLVVALAIRLEDGYVALYFQERLGKNNVPFKTIKFRTMVPEAERVLQEKLDSDPALRAEWETHFKLRRDPRITRVGAWLRKTSLDELPQLINVLRGEMSLVGPRPLPEYHQRELAARTQDLRTRLRPGLTGLWQVSGRSNIGTDGMERWDAYYVRNWSVWLDLVILFRTTRAVVKRSGAY